MNSWMFALKLLKCRLCWKIQIILEQQFCLTEELWPMDDSDMFCTLCDSLGRSFVLAWNNMGHWSWGCSNTTLSIIKWQIYHLHWCTLKKYLYCLYFSLNGESIKKRITKFWTYDENGSTLPTKGPNMDKNSLKKCFSISLDILKLKFALKCIFS